MTRATNAQSKKREADDLEPDDLDSETLNTELLAGTQRFQKELLAGTVSLMLLSLLARAEQPLYGYEIAKRFEQAEGNGPTIKRGTLYPALRSLESRGYLQSFIEPSEAGPPRRYYEATETGRRACAAWYEVWQETQSMVRTILAKEHE